jgi:hypothetical protein
LSNNYAQTEIGKDGTGGRSAIIDARAVNGALAMILPVLDAQGIQDRRPEKIKGRAEERVAMEKCPFSQREERHRLLIALMRNDMFFKEARTHGFT